jgi:flagellar hook-length control protein FliK
MLEMTIGKPNAARDGAATRPAERSKSEGEVIKTKFTDAYLAEAGKQNSAPEGTIPVDASKEAEVEPDLLDKSSETPVETGDQDRPAINADVNEVALSVPTPAVLSDQPRKMVLRGTSETAFGNQVAKVFERVQAISTADQQKSADQSLFQSGEVGTHDEPNNTDISVAPKKLRASNMAGPVIVSQTLRGGPETSFETARDVIPQLNTTTAQLGPSITQGNAVQPWSLPLAEGTDRIRSMIQQATQTAQTGQEGESERLQDIKQPPPQPTLRQTDVPLSPGALTIAATHATKPAIAPILRGEANASLEFPGVAPPDVEGISPVDSTLRNVSSSHPIFSRADTPSLIGRQLVEAVHRMPERPVELALNPEELGRVKMSISASDGGITVSLLAERPETLDLMRRHIDQLAREFQTLGYASINFAFTAGQENKSAEKGSSGEDQSKDGSEQKSEHHALGADPLIPIRLNLSTGLDLRL